MFGFLEIRTILAFSAVVSLATCICMVYVLMTRKVYAGFREWVFASLFAAIGIILLILRGRIPDFISVIIANTLIVFYFVLILRGIIEFCGKKTNLWLDLVPILLTISLLLWTYDLPDLNIRVAILFGMYALLTFSCAVVSFRHIPLVLETPNYLLSGTLLFWAISSSSRAMVALFLDDPLYEFLQAGLGHKLGSIAFTAGQVLTMASLITINAQRLEKEISSAEDEIKILRGFLPICSNCRKIRDDDGFWRQIESYISEHSEVVFSHGLCPECLQELYPDFSSRE